MDRRGFLGLSGGLLVDALASTRTPLEGRIEGTSLRAGHLLRDGGAPAPTGPVERVDVVVCGGGISGLAAAWRLAPLGMDVRVLELEPRVGGTSQSSDDGVVPHPWGAHYLPAPGPAARAVQRLLAEIGTLRGFDAAGRPRFAPTELCHAPEERVFYRGRWHTGSLVPRDALEPSELAAFGRLTSALDEVSARVGADGRPAFELPMALSSRDPELLALDGQSFARWLDERGLVTPYLRWYVRYCMLDDFGAEPEEVSAWAGLHYFTSRKLRSPELEGSRFLVWPEGNGRLARALLEGSRARVTTRALVLDVAPRRDGVEVTWLDLARGDSRRLAARAAVIAAPAFVTRRLLAAGPLPQRVSSPWLVANLHAALPLDPDRPWDSVLHGAVGLGYVDAGHQRFAPAERTVLTYYRAFGEADVSAARGRLANARWDELASEVLLDLAPAHPDLATCLERLDVMLWGHAMPRPVPGFLGDRPFAPPVRLAQNVAWAHVDQSGFALFEEAQARGVAAAEALAGDLRVELGETWL